ncbi:centrosomal protein of 120 kDa-like [Helicoverpa zea]|uniref:centrosomal protein of 120 kDa-like n=1 Tax=Helicoverpa zea TaxID=7113 RepID=UPI001F57F645|nr:centrosomal protein of 120 kDa-like [Helicoverpa zea]
MDELRGPNIQIVLHVKEGLGFGFLRSPFIVSGSLNGYMLETDPVVPSHAPIFDAELVWEADKRRFRSLRVQNVPVKVEVHTMGTQGRKDKVGYLLLSLLGAQPCPSHKNIEVKHSWHRLLGVKSEGKCCHPQLLMSLSVEDRINTPTPRNELRMFHSNEVAFPAACLASNPPTAKSMLMSLKEYISESKRVVSSPDLIPQLLCDEGLIRIGAGKQLFVLSFVIGAVENLDLLLPDRNANREVNCYVTYSVFTHNISTDRVAASLSSNGGSHVQFNQRTSLRLASDLATLSRYFAECPHLVTRVCAAENDVGICSMDLRKLIPTEDIQHFVDKFCNSDGALTIHERCFILRCDDTPALDYGRRPFVDVEMSLKYLGVKQEVQKKPNNLTARSATHLESGRRREAVPQEHILDFRAGSCTNVARDVGGVAYTNLSATNTARYKTASGDTVLQSTEIAELIKKMYESLTVSQELLQTRVRPTTADMQVQCDTDAVPHCASDTLLTCRGDNKPDKLETSKSDTCITHNEKDMVKMTIPAIERDAIMQKFVDELEDWKEKQQEMFKCQLKRKEEYHLELLAKEWAKKQVELECKLSKGIEQCRNLAADLSRATDDFRLRGYRNTDREKKLHEAKKALESHYTAKYQELREASQKMEDDMNHQLKLKDMRVEELEVKVQQLQKQVELLKNNIKNTEKECESRYSGLTKDQTASLIQELRYLEEKLDSAVQSKSFFKEQWGRAVRELHLVKLSTRRQMLTQLQEDRKQLGEMGLEPIEDQDENSVNSIPVDLKKLKDDFYVDILANTPTLNTHSIINPAGPDELGMYNDLKNAPKNPMNERINELIAQRDRLVQQDNPDEDLLKHLNHEIRSLLLNCGT